MSDPLRKLFPNAVGTRLERTAAKLMHRPLTYIPALGDKSSLSKFKKIEIISSIFSDHNAMRLEINYTEKNVKNTNTWRLNNTLLNNQDITEEIKEEIKKYLQTNDSENTMTQSLWDAAKAVLRRKL